MEKTRSYLFEKVVIGFAFTFYFLITSYKLTNAPLWFDETIEYWYSKIMFGTLPFENSLNMYQRIISTYQPPLYNFLMYFWLKVSDTEWWFRFFGVLMGFIGNLGIYKSIKKNSNGYIAAITVMFSSCIFRLVYYWQECAEYCLMMGTLCWTIYLFLDVIETQTTKNIVLFTASTIFPIYSQYGAIFPVISMIIVAYIYILAQREKKAVKIISISYIVAFIVAALPLIIFFGEKQIRNQQNGKIQVATLSFDGNIIKDFLLSIKVVLEWSFFSYYGTQFIKIFITIFIAIFIITFILTKKKGIQLLGIINVITWVLYYAAVKVGLYSYGEFGNRYNLFFLPLWIVTLFGFGIESYEILKDRCSSKLKNIKYYYMGICLNMLICYMYLSWTLKIQENWNNKDNMRDPVKMWISENAENSNTIVYYAGDSGFAYYLRQYDGYTESMEKNVNYMYWYQNKSVEEYEEYVSTIYGEEWPDDVYIIGSHIKDDFDTLTTAFINRGYKRTDLYNLNGILIHLNNSTENHR